MSTATQSPVVKKTGTPFFNVEQFASVGSAHMNIQFMRDLVQFIQTEPGNDVEIPSHIWAFSEQLNRAATKAADFARNSPVNRRDDDNDAA